MRKKKIIIICSVIAGIFITWGIFVRPPVDGGKFSSAWGLRFLKGSFFHPGSDISLPIGSPVHPVTFGKVRETGFNERHGNYMIISHLPGIESRYMHMNSLIAAEGDLVKFRTVIGTVGSTGTMSTGPHIHFEIRVLNKPLPAYLICLPGRMLQKIGLFKLLGGKNRTGGTFHIISGMQPFYTP